MTTYPRQALMEMPKGVDMRRKLPDQDTRLKRIAKPPTYGNQRQSNNFNIRPFSNVQSNKQNYSNGNKTSARQSNRNNISEMNHDVGSSSEAGNRHDDYDNIAAVNGPDDILAALTNSKRKNKSNMKPRIVASVKIGNKKADSLIDSGATRNVISRDLVKIMGCSCMIETADITSCSGFDGKPTNIDGQIELDIDIGMLRYSGKFIVVPKLSKYPIILGAPFLEKHGVMNKLETHMNSICGSEAIRRGN